MTDFPVDGRVHEGYEQVADVFRQNFAHRDELGAAVAVVVDGRPVVDLWGGWTGPDRTTPWDRRTLTNVWSATKGLLAICALQLIESGDLEPDAPIARYWPEFAKAGKAHIPVRWLLSHRSGVTGLEQPITDADLLDWPKMIGLLAAQGPLFEPGGAIGHYSLSYGYLVGEVIRRITGLTVGEFLLANVARPLDADVHIGLSAGDLPRCSTTVEPDVIPALPAVGCAALAAFANPRLTAALANQAGWRVAEVPAANGHATAFGLATVYGCLADGSGRLLQRPTIELGRSGQGPCADLIAGLGAEFGLGFMLGFGPSPRAFGHDGFGGCTGFADPERGVGFAYVTNRMGPGLRTDPRRAALVEAVYGCLGS
ncbi:serine hydrolase domain-containing protein [Kutzneria chonburiensis]|uniref:Serine hydrolase domain-containing protein n=1 Tax=Kutzneria chonburiensis TaxID=1483604 RepID=A0ABV6N8X6_9PSEU|nr:serine hydrolase domain-containing protein [Kutzneria chonburiensis]